MKIPVVRRWGVDLETFAKELKIPVVRRWGVDLETYREVLRDPQSPKVPTLIYKHQFAGESGFVAPDILELLTFDPAFKDMHASGPHLLTLADIKNKKVCPDLPVPIPTAPQARVVLKGDLLSVLQQVSDKND